MGREIKIFKSFQEQDEYHIERMRNSSVFERFRTLFQMQKTTKLFHPLTDKIRKIIIQKNGHTQP
jgi:hypothetical protein